MRFDPALHLKQLSVATRTALETAWLILDGWDEELALHGQSVAQELIRLAPMREQELWLWAGRLHDLGKITVPAALLYKRGALNRREKKLMQQHALYGAALLKEIGAPRTIVQGVKYHHERWDGTGYPTDIREEQIPLIARALAIADAYATLTNDRPYRRAVSPEQARAEIERHAGTQFDPALVQQFFAEREKKWKAMSQ